MKNKKSTQKLLKIRNEFYTFLARIFGLKHEIDNTKYRKLIYLCLRFNDSESQCEFITYIKSFKHKDNVIVEIETHRPGILIGKAGHLIQKIKTFIEEETRQKIDIKVYQSKLWTNLYPRINK